MKGNADKEMAARLEAAKRSGEVSFRNFADMTKEDSDLLMSMVPTAVEATVPRILQLLRDLEHVPRCGLPVDQLEHAVQSATRAYRDNAPDERILMSLCHDIGKAISIVNHPAIGAEILRPFVSDDTYRIVLTHADFQGRYSYPHRSQDPESYRQYEKEPWFDDAIRFSDEWDCPAFDPDYESLPLAEFEPLVVTFFSKKRWAGSTLHNAPTE